MKPILKIIKTEMTHSSLLSSKIFRKWTAVILVFALFNLIGGCYNYFKINSSPQPSTETITSLSDAGKTIIIHFNNKMWLLSDVLVKNNSVLGTLSEYDKPPTFKPVKADRPNRYLTRASNNQRFLLNEVHLYLDEFTQMENSKVSIPVSAINKLEIYDRDTATTVGSYFLGTLGYTAAAFVVIGVIVALTKESCPFIYTWDGENYQFSGEIYSGSIHKPLERNDYLKLATYHNQQSYSLKITNEVREIQHTNLLELLVIDHHENTTILTDKNGQIHCLSHTMVPNSATSLSGENVTELMSSKDNLFYQSASTQPDLPVKDGVILEFPNQGKARTAKLAIHAKNSIMLDYMIGQFHDLFGKAYKGYMKRQQDATEGQMRQWALNQGIPLSVYVERDRKWEFVDYYNIAGPMKFKDDVLSIPLRGNETVPLKVKMEYGSFLWEIDYAAVDYSTNEEVKSYTVPIKTAISEDQKDVTSLILNDDLNYYTQPSMDNAAIVTFDLPELTDQERTIILHSKGWYEIIRDPVGKPDIDKLKAFRNPGHFNQFVNTQLKQLEQQAN